MVFVAYFLAQVNPTGVFQSLIGVYGFCGLMVPTQSDLCSVSIPDRGLWFLWRVWKPGELGGLRFNP